MYTRYRGPMQPRIAPPSFQSYYHMPPPTYGMMSRGATGMRQSGGLLSRILQPFSGAGTGQSFNAYRSVAPASAVRSGSSFLQSLTNPTSINQFLSSTQKVLNTAQQVGPFVQQYGPIVKNLPAMWKLYRGLKDAPDLSETESANEEKAETLVEPIEAVEGAPPPSRRNATSASKPRLYI